MLVVPEGMVMLLMLRHFSKAPSPMLIRLSGNTIELSDTQLLNALSPMLMSRAGSDIRARLPHEAKASSPM